MARPYSVLKAVPGQPDHYESHSIPPDLLSGLARPGHLLAQIALKCVSERVHSAYSLILFPAGASIPSDIGEISTPTETFTHSDEYKHLPHDEPRDAWQQQQTIITLPLDDALRRSPRHQAKAYVLDHLLYVSVLAGFETMALHQARFSVVFKVRGGPDFYLHTNTFYSQVRHLIDEMRPAPVGWVPVKEVDRA